MRLVDADAFLTQEIERCDGEMPYLGTCTTNNYTLKCRIDNAPTVDAEPVKHGQWAIKQGVCTLGGDPLLYCPFCRSEESEHMGGIEMPRNWNYCPNCGAKMDLETK